MIHKHRVCVLNLPAVPVVDAIMIASAGYSMEHAQSDNRAQHITHCTCKDPVDHYTCQKGCVSVTAHL